MSLTPVPHKATFHEALLIQGLLDRNEQAMHELHALYPQSLMAVILRLVRDEAWAQDLLQEAWLKVWLSIASYDAERGRLFTWLARGGSNHAIDALRRRRHRFHCQNRSLALADAERVPAPTSFKPEHIGVRELAAQLKPRQREIIELLYFGGCTQAEAAEMLCIPLPTVKTRLRAALQVLATLAR